MNYMKQVAATLGLVFNENFTYRDVNNNEMSDSIYCFKSDGVYKYIGNEIYIPNNDILINILRGRYEIIKSQWCCPCDGDIVYIISPTNTIEEIIYNSNHPIHLALNDYNLIFRNKLFAEEYLNKHIKENN